MDSLTGPQPIPAPFFQLLTEKLKLYYITGGMPEAVSEWIDRVLAR
jgi:hypothetical protein